LKNIVSEQQGLYLPASKRLPISSLIAVFKNTSASYKFYWFLSILELAEKGKEDYTFRELNIRMIALSWYTINFHKLSFGSQDKLEQAIKTIISFSDGKIGENDDKDKIIKFLEHNYDIFKKEITHFNKKVPYHFLSPFIGTQKNIKQWIEASLMKYNDNSPCLYHLSRDHISIHPEWLEYLIDNKRLLIDFSLWNFVHKFLEPRNPNIPNITQKLIKRPKRESLNIQTKLWDSFAKEVNLISIYTKKKIDEYALDHFVPWSFVSHNQLWNLAPIESSLNSSKSNKLPNKNLVDTFCEQQFHFFNHIISSDSLKISKKKLEDYSNIFKLHTKDIVLKEKGEFIRALSDHINPLLQFASNSGFQNWEYDI